MHSNQVTYITLHGVSVLQSANVECSQCIGAHCIKGINVQLSRQKISADQIVSVRAPGSKWRLR